jgi:predicted nicotinamide N-methyase
MPSYNRRLERIRREFQTTTETISVGDQRLCFTRVADPDAVLDAICAQEAARRQGAEPKRPLRMPYWAAVWESGLAMCRYLAERNARHPMTGLETLDLGCGMGMAGMALAALGARVTLVDLETACLPFATLNTLPWADRVYVRRCDWQRDDLRRQYDLIVGSDVLYEVDQWPHVELFIRKHLKPDGTVLIGEPGRPKAEAFPAWIRARGWSLSATGITQGIRTINVLELNL